MTLNTNTLIGQTDIPGRNNSAMINKANIARPDSCVGPECRIVDGKLNGTCITLWPDSSIKSEGIYLNDTISGAFRKWFEDGQLEEERIKTHDNLNGTIMKYWPNGALKTLCIYSEGAIDQRMQWNENGGLDLQEIYSNNEHLRLIKYRSNGELEYSGTKINGSRSGQWRKYDVNGRLCSILEYDNGNLLKEEQFCP